MVRRFKAMPPPAVFVSPSITSGYDVSAEETGCRYIIVGKCVPDSTKIVTYDGIKSASELRVGDMAYSLNSKGIIELAPVTNIFHSVYSVDMLGIKNKSMTMRVTPDHRSLVINYRHKPKYQFRKADSLLTKYASRWMSIPRSGTWKGKGSNVIDLRRFIIADDVMLLRLPKGIEERKRVKLLYPFLRYDTNNREWIFHGGDVGLTSQFWEYVSRLGGVVLCKGRHGHVGTPLYFESIDFMSLVGWYASEGYKFNHVVARTSGIIIRQNKNHNRTKITQLCDSLGLHYRIDGGRKVTIVGELLHRAFEYYCPGYAKTKDIAVELKQYPKVVLQAMLGSLIAGDGSVSKTGARVYYTMSEKLAYSVSEIAIKTGNSVRIATESGRGFEVGLRRTTKSSLNGIKKEPYDGRVWCPTVAGNGNFLAYEGGCFFFTGNCPYPDTSDPVMMARQATDKEWSSFMAASTLTQECGRLTRSATDKAEVLVVDDSIVWFMRLYGKKFTPAWFMARWKGSLQSVPDPLVP
jgi:hypothetical protein